MACCTLPSLADSANRTKKPVFASGRSKVTDPANGRADRRHRSRRPGRGPRCRRPGGRRRRRCPRTSPPYSATGDDTVAPLTGDLSTMSGVAAAEHDHLVGALMEADGRDRAVGPCSHCHGPFTCGRRRYQGADDRVGEAHDRNRERTGDLHRMRIASSPECGHTDRTFPAGGWLVEVTSVVLLEPGEPASTSTPSSSSPGASAITATSTTTTVTAATITSDSSSPRHGRRGGCRSRLSTGRWFGWDCAETSCTSDRF